MSNEISTLDLLLGFPGLQIKGHSDRGNIIYIYAKASDDTPPVACPCCGNTWVRKDGGYIREAKDFPIRGKPVIFQIDTFRYECVRPSCQQKKFVPRFPQAIDENSQLTIRLRDAIASCDFSKRTFDDVAKQYGVDRETVRRIFLEKVRELDQETKYDDVVCLGIDEAHLAKEMRGVLVDCSSKKAKLIDLLPDRRQQTIVAALRRFENLGTIRYVTMDMSAAYRDAVLAELPNAIVVVDRFHVILHLIEATEKARKATEAMIEAEIAQLPAGKRDRETDLWKSQRKVINHFWFKKNVTNLTDRQYRGLATLMKNYPAFGDVIRTKEQFSAIYDCATRTDAEAMYDAWYNDLMTSGNPGLEPFKALARTVSNWHEWIFNYFDVEPGISRTNGPTEAINGEIKRINKMGRGYSFEVLRGKLLYGAGQIKLRKRTVNVPDPKTTCYLWSLNTFRGYDWMSTTEFEPDDVITDMYEIIKVALDLHPELEPKWGFLLEYVQSQEYLMLQEYILGHDPDLEGALKDAADVMDNLPPYPEHLLRHIKLPVELEILSRIVDTTMIAVKADYDSEMIQSYR